MNKKRLHIAHFTNTYHPFISGVVRSISTFRQGLVELGHNVFIFAQYASDHQDSEPFIFRYPAIDLPIAQNFALAIPIAPFVDRLLPALKLDVIHSHHPLLLGQAAANQAEQLDLPLVFTFHTRYREYSHYLPLDQKFAKRAIDRWLGDYMQKCQHIITPSNSIKEILANEYGVTSHITTIPTGINLEPYRQAEGQTIRQERGWGNSTVLISVGRLAKEKNWTTLLAAAAQVMETHNSVRLAIIGDGDDRKSLKKYAQELGIANRVEFVGQVPFADIPGYLKAADIFCFASVTETQGLVTMEAIAADLPVVAVNATGTQDVIEHGKEGILTENDSTALAQGLQQVLDDDALRQQLKQNAGQKAKTFDIVNQAQKLIEVYGQAAEDKKADRYVKVDKRKEIFKVFIDEEWWNKLLGGQKKYFQPGEKP